MNDQTLNVPGLAQVQSGLRDVFAALAARTPGIELGKFNPPEMDQICAPGYTAASVAKVSVGKKSVPLRVDCNNEGDFVISLTSFAGEPYAKTSHVLTIAANRTDDTSCWYICSRSLTYNESGRDFLKQSYLEASACANQPELLFFHALAPLVDAMIRKQLNGGKPVRRDKQTGLRVIETETANVA